MNTFSELERAVGAALETYSNVHRGSGHFSLASTELYEEARRAPEVFEAGTPAIINVIAFARALQLHQEGPREPPATVVNPAQVAEALLHRDGLEGLTGRPLLNALRATVIGREARVPTAGGLRRFINLDNGASTPALEPIWATVRQAWRQPEPVQRALVQEVRAICARVLGAPLADHEVLFTANTTDAINLVAQSLHAEAEPGVQTVVLNTLLEHNSNELPWRMTSGLSLVQAPVDGEGFVELEALERVLRAYNQDGLHEGQRVKLIAISGASNVLGSCNDLAALARLAHRHGARLLVDAAQLVSHRKIDLAACEIDLLAFSAHKAYAPFGTGVLIARRGALGFGPAELEALRASGDENVAGIAALGKALDLLARVGFEVLQAEEQALTAQALRGLARIPGLQVYGVQDPASPRFAAKSGVIVFGVKGLMADKVALALAARFGIGVRAGCHCAHRLIKHLLGISPALERSSGRW